MDDDNVTHIYPSILDWFPINIRVENERTHNYADIHEKPLRYMIHIDIEKAQNLIDALETAIRKAARKA
jgi:hypothetical protein